MTSLSRFFFLTAWAFAAFSPAAFALGAAEAAAGREIVKKHAGAVVGVEMVLTIKTTQGDRTNSRELKREFNGTTISATGLTVIALSEIEVRANNVRVDEFKEVKLRLPDGSEIPARVVLKDEDLDIAFVAPEPDKVEGVVFSFVDLTTATEPAILETYYDLSRAPKTQQRAVMVKPVYVTGIIEKPRRFVLASDYSSSCPTFNAEGKLLGIAVRHISGGRQGGYVILPAVDVAELAQQAAAVKIEPGAAETPATEVPAAEPVATPTS